MASRERLRLVIEADTKSSQQAFQQTNQSISSLDQMATRVAASIGQRFSRMTSDIRNAVDQLRHAFSGLDSQARQAAQTAGRVSGPGGGGSAFNGGAVAAGAAAAARGAGTNSTLHDLYRRAVKSEGTAEFDKARAAFAADFARKFKFMVEATAADLKKICTSKESFKALEDAQRDARRYMAAVEAKFRAEQSGSRFGAAWANTRAGMAFRSFGNSTRNWNRIEENGPKESILDSMFGNMAKGYAAYELINMTTEAMKKLTIESAKFAAVSQTYEVAMYAIGKANGYAEKQITDTAQQIHDQNMSWKNTRQAMGAAMAMRVNLDQLPQLVTMAQNQAVVRPDQTSGEILNNMLHGIQTGQTDVMRAAGVNVNFEDSYKRYARELPKSVEALSEAEKMQARYNATLAEAPKLAGVYKEAYDTPGKALQSMRQKVEDATEAIGKYFLPAMVKVVEAAKWALDEINKNPTVAKAVATSAGTLTGTAVGAAAGATIGGIAGSVLPGAGTAAGAILGAKIGGFVGGTAGYYISSRSADKYAQEQEAAKKAREANRAQNERDAAATRARLDAEEAAKERARRQAEIDDMIKAARKQSLRAANDAVLDAQSKKYEGRFGIEHEFANRTKQLTTYQDKEGNLHAMPAAAAAEIRGKMEHTKRLTIEAEQTRVIRDLNKEIASEKAGQLEGIYRINAEEKQALDTLKQQGYDTDALVKKTKDLYQAKRDSAVKEAEKSAKDRAAQAVIQEHEGYKRITAELEYELKQLDLKKLKSDAVVASLKGEADARRRILDQQIATEIRQGANANAQQAGQNEIAGLEEATQARLTSLDGVYAYDLKTKLAVEQQKFAVESEYLDKILAKQKQLRANQYQFELDELNRRIDREGLSKDQADALRRQKEQQYNADIARMGQANAAQHTELAKRSAIQQRDMIITEYTKLYDRLKQGFGSIFDSMVAKGKSAWQVIADFAKMALLSVMKEILASQFARRMTGLLTGQPVRNALVGGVMQGRAGMVGGILGSLGMGQPVFGGQQAGGGLFGGGSTSPMGGLGGYIGTPPFMPGSTARGSYGVGAGAAQAPAAASVPYVIGPDGLPSKVTGLDPRMWPAIGQKAPFQLAGGFTGKNGAMLNNLMGSMGLMIAVGGATQGKGVGGTINRGVGGAMAAYGIAGKQLGVMGSMGAGLAYDGIVRGGWAGIDVPRISLPKVIWNARS